jgi:hypothetical protein
MMAVTVVVVMTMMKTMTTLVIMIMMAIESGYFLAMSVPSVSV